MTSILLSTHFDDVRILLIYAIKCETMEDIKIVDEDDDVLNGWKLPDKAREEPPIPPGLLEWYGI